MVLFWRSCPTAASLPGRQVPRARVAAHALSFFGGGSLAAVDGARRVDHKHLPSIDEDEVLSKSVKAMNRKQLEDEADSFWSQYPDARKRSATSLTATGRSTRSLRVIANLQSPNPNNVDAGRDFGEGESNAGETRVGSVLSSSPPGFASASTLPQDRDNDPSSSSQPGFPELRKRHLGSGLSPLGDSSRPEPKRPRRAAAERPMERIDGTVPYNSDAISDKDMPPHGHGPGSRITFSSSFDGSSFKPDSESRASSERPEKLTVRLVSTFIRHALFWAPPQHVPELAGSPVDFDDAELLLWAKLHDSLEFRAVDDGGLRIAISDGGSVHSARVAMIEAKRALQLVGDDAEWHISDERFAQIVGEALAMRLNPDKWAGPRDSIFIIVAARYYLRFLELKITDGYINSLKDHAVAGLPHDECLEVHAARWFDLRQPKGRLRSLRNISGIVSFGHRNVNPLMDDEDQSMS
ncbi:hypothetical protein CPLU01_04428 [Colletotrichum plurivorum]|uniref:Uncharacterized protein n=1 Tax=Colletotrichum plurivorum TaxID=2175906 RepID=A0A8H6KQ68_9PEZI|nr:hypothetical protein CPLU01_04428 [Colletotrichum plurivorum]